MSTTLRRIMQAQGCEGCPDDCCDGCAWRGLRATGGFDLLAAALHTEHAIRVLCDGVD